MQLQSHFGSLSSKRKKAMRHLLKLIISSLLISSAFNLKAQDQGQVFLEERAYSKAKLYYSNIINTGNTSKENVLGLGRSLMYLEEYDKAVNHYEKFITLNSQVSEYYHALGEVLLQKLENGSMFEKMRLAGQVKDNYIKAVDLDAQNIGARTSLTYFYSEAPGIAGGSFENAKEHANIIIGQNPLKGYQLMSNVYLKNEDYELAVGELENLFKAGVPEEEIFYKQGRLYQDIENYDKAFKLFNKSINKNKNYSPPYYQYARTSVFSNKNLDISIEYMIKYLLLDVLVNMPDHSSANWRLGMLYELKGEEKNAKNAYVQALKINPNNKEAKKALAALN